MSGQKALGILLFVVGLLFALTMLWVWAFFGLDPNIGLAAGITAAVFIFGGGALATKPES